MGIRSHVGSFLISTLFLGLLAVGCGDDTASSDDPAVVMDAAATGDSAVDSGQSDAVAEGAADAVADSAETDASADAVTDQLPQKTRRAGNAAICDTRTACTQPYPITALRPIIPPDQGEHNRVGRHLRPSKLSSARSRCDRVSTGSGSLPSTRDLCAGGAFIDPPGRITKCLRGLTSGVTVWHRTRPEDTNGVAQGVSPSSLPSGYAL